MQILGILAALIVIGYGARAWHIGRNADIEFRRVIGRRVVGGRWTDRW